MSLRYLKTIPTLALLVYCVFSATSYAGNKEPYQVLLGEKALASWDGVGVYASESGKDRIILLGNKSSTATTGKFKLRLEQIAPKDKNGATRSDDNALEKTVLSEKQCQLKAGQVCTLENVTGQQVKVTRLK